MSMTGNMELGVSNPFRYRGYYCDTESGLYYLNSRYYDPVTGRFINADSYVSTGQGLLGNNMFAYCANDPINLVDNNGNFFMGLGWELVKLNVSVKLHAFDAFLSWCGVDTAAVGGYLLDMTKIDGIYHANFDCWQQYFGYNDLYNIMFDIGTSMRSAICDFVIGSRVYRFWAWKGDYINLGAGAELGIYVGNGPHLFVDKSVAMPMQMWLNDRNGTNIITYTDGGKQWWCTGFNENFHIYNANSLTAIFSIQVFKYGNV